jgi:putative inorganic carbon (HCO3(-)) transporter
MAHKPPISDYEPVSRSKPSASGYEEPPADGGFHFPSEKSDSFAKTVSGFSDADKPLLGKRTDSYSEHQPPTLPDKVRPLSQWPTKQTDEPADRQSTREAKPAAESKAEKWVFKRGHSLSFAGLFLFTVVLYFRPYEFSTALAWLSSSAFWLATGTLVIFIPTQLGLEGRITTRPREVNLILILLCLALLSIPLALEKSAGWGAFTEYVKVVVMFIVMVNVVRTEKRLRALLVLVLAASCVVGIGAINDYRLGNLALEGGRISGVIGGIFGNPNDLALHLVTMVPLAVGMMLTTRNPFTKTAYLLCGLLLMAGIIATFSRGGFLGISSAVFVLTWKLAPRGRIAFGVLALLVILAVVGLAPGAFRSRIATTQDESAIARTDDLKRSIFLAVRHPLLGVGMGNYVFYSNRNKVTHNAYTQVAAEMGVLAALSYLLFVIAPLKPLRRIERENRDSKPKPRLYYLSIALQASLVGYMVSSFFASVAYSWYVYYLVGYAVCLRRIYEMNKAAQPG